MSWMYKYKLVIREMNEAIRKLNNPALRELWETTKKDIKAIAKGMSRETDDSFIECHAATWSRWEDLISGDEWYSDVEEGLMYSAVEFKEHCPDPLWSHINYALEIAFAQGRGFTRKEAIKEQDDFLASQGGWDAYFHSQNEGLTHLTVIEGGKA